MSINISSVWRGSDCYLAGPVIDRQCLRHEYCARFRRRRAISLILSARGISADANPSAGIRPIDITFSAAFDVLYRARNADSAKLLADARGVCSALRQFETIAKRTKRSALLSPMSSWIST